MNDRGPNDLELIIERLKEKIENLKRDNKTLVKEIDRLSEYNNNLERMIQK